MGVCSGEQWVYSTRMLSKTHSRIRQQRLLAEMSRQELDAVVVGLTHHVQYFTTYRTGHLYSAAMVLMADGRCTLIAPNEVHSAADTLIKYEADWNGTHRQDHPAEIAGIIRQILPRKTRRVGMDASMLSGYLRQQALVCEMAFIDSTLWQMRRAKDEDELELMAKATACTSAMYDVAREMIEPGLDELDLYNALAAAAVTEAGEAMPGLLGNDFACGAGGGSARPGRLAKAGELYILDLGPCYRGYWADNARVFAVDGKPTDIQHKTWSALCEVFGVIETLARPGVRCVELVEAVDELLMRRLGKTVPHHLGHGVGLQPHEYPHLNRKWDDVLIEGEIFTVEPGLYGPDLAGGIRVENNYRVTATGVENLTPFLLELA